MILVGKITYFCCHFHHLMQIKHILILNELKEEQIHQSSRGFLRLGLAASCAWTPQYGIQCLFVCQATQAKLISGKYLLFLNASKTRTACRGNFAGAVATILVGFCSYMQLCESKIIPHYTFYQHNCLAKKIIVNMWHRRF